MDGFGLQVLQVAFVCFCLLVAVAAGFDLWKFVIPNTVSAAVALLFVATALLLRFGVGVPVDWLSHLGAGLSVLVAGLLMYRFNVLGAGDVKLLTAVSFWTSFEHLALYLFAVAVCGGAVSALLWALRRLIVSLLTYFASSPGEIALPRVLLIGEPIPYGVGIAGGAVYIANQLPLLGGYL